MSAKILQICAGLIFLSTGCIRMHPMGTALATTLTDPNCSYTNRREVTTLQSDPCNVGANEVQEAALPVIAYAIPTLDDWQSTTLAFSHGAEGAWDYYLLGGFANSLIKKGDTYYLYYQGSPSYDAQCDSVSYRAIGVATSTDGIHWVKSAKNPVVSWVSQGSIEEGAVSSAAWLGADGKVYLYYGANTGSGCTVRANARLAVSENGEDFQDLGEVLSGNDPNVWGSGDEIFPVGAYAYENQWYLYYIPNGVSLSRKLGVAIGNSSNSFIQTSGLNNSTIPAWGPVSIHLQGSDSVLMTNPNDGNESINIYKFDAANPSLVQLYDAYTIPNCTQSSMIYESSVPQWVMACRDQAAESYYIKRASLLHIFADVPQTHWAWSWIERFYAAGITSGCANNPMRYCPDGSITRAQMAVFLLRGIHGSAYVPPAVGGNTGFDDVEPTDFAAAWIKQLAAEGITAGCGANTYCPNQAVNRAQMAVFLLKSKYGNAYTPPPATGVFADVDPNTHFAAAWIEQLAAEGITAGCGGNNYCPNQAVNRAQMAIFLVKTFNLP